MKMGLLPQGEAQQYSSPEQWEGDQSVAAYNTEVPQPAQSYSMEEMTAGHNARMAAIQNSSAAHNARMSALQGQFDAHNTAWANDQRVGEERHAQNIHAINGEYEYADRGTGQRYWVPGEVQNPTASNPDGTQTELQQYTPSSDF